MPGYRVRIAKPLLNEGFACDAFGRIGAGKYRGK